MTQSSDYSPDLIRIVQFAIEQPPGQRLAALRSDGRVDDDRAALREIYRGYVASIALNSDRGIQEVIDEYCEDELPWRDEVRSLVLGEAINKVEGLAGEAREQELRRTFRGDASLLADAIKDLPMNERQQWSPAAAGAIINDRYRLVKRLGIGGFGTVWQAQELHSESRLVAVKFLNPARMDCISRRRFAEECAAIRDIKHPGVVTYLSHGVDMKVGGPFLVMTWIDGRSIDEHVKRSNIGVAGVVRLVRDGARAAQAIHDRRFIHRDIKPTNIMIDSKGNAIIVDLGICRPFEHAGRASLTETGLQPGTLLYMAPEQLAGETPGFGVDVYALGMVLFVLLTDDARADLSQPLRDTVLRKRGIDSRLCNICAKALEHGPGSRYRSAIDLADELSSWLLDNDSSLPREIGPDARYPEAEYRAKQAGKLRRWRNVFVGIACGLVVSTLTTGWFWYQAVKSESEAQARQLQAGQAVSLLLRSIERLDPHARMSEGGGPLAKQELKDLRDLLLTYQSLDSEQKRKVLAAIASTAFSVEDYKTSESTFRDLLAAARESGEASTSELALAHLGVGRSLHMLGQRGEAVKSLREAIRIYGQLQPPDEGKLLACRTALANALLDDGNVAGARATLDADLKMLAQAGAVSDVRIMTFAHDFVDAALVGARLAWADGQEDPSPLYKAALTLSKHSDLMTLKVLYSRAILLADKGEWIGAERDMRTVAHAFESVFGESSGQTVRALSLLARVLRQQDELDEAQEIADRAVVIADDLHPPDDEAMDNALKFSASIHTARANAILRSTSAASSGQAMDQARPEYLDAIARYNRLVGRLEYRGQQHTLEYADVLQSLGVAYFQMRQFGRAEEHYQSALRVAERVTGWPVNAKTEPPPLIRSIMFLQARLMCESEPTRSQEAADLLGPVAEAAMNHRDWPDNVRLVEEYVRALKLSGRVDEAKRCEEWLSGL